MSDTSIHEQLTRYLTDAHALEVMSLQQLKKAPEISGDPELSRVLEAHLTETVTHESRVQALLDERGASSSRTKDVVLKAGGEGFVLFARSQPDRTGKLAAHALAYEALEWASYDLLARTADAAGEPAVARVAREIRDDERAMMTRIEGLLHRTADRALDEAAHEDPLDLLRIYLADAHAIETQSVQLLRSARQTITDRPPLRARFDEHQAASESHRAILAERLEAMSAGPSRLKDAALGLGGLGWDAFFLGHPDPTGKLVAFVYAFAHLKIGGYEQLHRVADRAGAPETATAVEGMLGEERAAATRWAEAFDEAVAVALAEQGVSGR